MLVFDHRIIRLFFVPYGHIEIDLYRSLACGVVSCREGALKAVLAAARQRVLHRFSA